MISLNVSNNQNQKIASKQQINIMTSNNPKIQKIYKELKNYENVDADYWNAAGFSNITSVLNQFDSNDFVELREAIKIWSSSQKGIFAETIIIKNPN